MIAWLVEVACAVAMCLLLHLGAMAVVALVKQQPAPVVVDDEPPLPKPQPRREWTTENNGVWGRLLVHRTHNGLDVLVNYQVPRSNLVLWMIRNSGKKYGGGPGWNDYFGLGWGLDVGTHRHRTYGVGLTINPVHGLRSVYGFWADKAKVLWMDCSPARLP